MHIFWELHVLVHKFVILLYPQCVPELPDFCHELDVADVAGVAECKLGGGIGKCPGLGLSLGAITRGAEE